MIELSVAETQKIVNYLVGRPWSEVNELISILAKAAENAKVQEEKKDVEAIKEES